MCVIVSREMVFIKELILASLKKSIDWSKTEFVMSKKCRGILKVLWKIIYSRISLYLVPSTVSSFPRKVDIRNYMYKASVKMRFSKLDQENVEELVKHWQQESPSTSFYLQLYELQHDVMGNKEASF